MSQRQLLEVRGAPGLEGRCTCVSTVCKLLAGASQWQLLGAGCGADGRAACHGAAAIAQASPST